VSANSSSHTQTPGQPGARRILLVEDNQDISGTMTELLGLLGHDVTPAYDGASAIGIAGQSAFDVILLDIGLPDMDGSEVARAIRTQEGHRDTRLIALSGWGQDQINEMQGAECFNEFWVKPVAMDKLQGL
jgi:CheY-like chemotaxis protein